jgi:hypothetical protein
MEGLPSILLGLVIFMLLPSSIATTRFLTPPEREALAAEVSRDHVPGPLASDLRGAVALLAATLRNGYIWMSGLCGALTSVASHTVRCTALQWLRQGEGSQLRACRVLSTDPCGKVCCILP